MGEGSAYSIIGVRRVFIFMFFFFFFFFCFVFSCFFFYLAIWKGHECKKNSLGY